MRIGRLGRLLAAGAGLVCMGAGPAQATPPGPWQQVSGSGVSDITEVGLARTADGTLHAAWSSQQAGNTQSINLVPISPSGQVGAMQTAVSGWASTDNPALGLAPSGALQLFFGGIHTLSPTDPNADENLATSSDGGSSWALTPSDVVAPAASAYASQVAVSNSFAPQATPFETWTGTSGVWVHAGIDPSSPNSNSQTALGGCCGYYANLASDGSGNTELAWYSNATGRGGIWAQAVGGSGAPVGSPEQMPGTASLGVGELQRTPLVARQQGGFYIAYPTGAASYTGVELWKVGGAALKIAGAQKPTAVGAAVDPAGRVWVFWWSDQNGHPEVSATRSNPTVTRFGAVVAVGGSPLNTSTVYNTDGNAAAGALDVFATISTGSGQSSIWTRHLYPGLSARLSPSSAKLRHTTKFTITVTDAGVPVKGASVRMGKHKAITDGAGRATITLTVPGYLKATASKAGYANGWALLEPKH